MTSMRVEAREIPVPKTVSPEAQAFLARPPMVTGPEIPHTDKDAWRGFVANVNAMMTQVGAARAAAFPCEVREHALPNCTLYELVPASLNAAHEDKALLHVHGGAFIVGAGISAAYTAQTYASLTGLRSFSVDYRMPPDHPYPHGLDDCMDAYRWVLERYAAQNIAFEGSSAGAALVGSLALRARDEGLPIPGACSMHTAGVDLTGAGDTFQTNAGIDTVLTRHQPETMLLYAGGHDLADPYISALFGDFTKGFPPSILTSGTRDLLLSPTVQMHRALLRAGIEAELHVFEAMPHGGLSGTSPEDRELQAQIAEFLKRKLGVS